MPAPGVKGGWSVEKTMQLRELFDQGLTDPLIARALGPEFTVCAVLGKRHRLGLCLTETRRKEAQLTGARQMHAERGKGKRAPKPKPAPRLETVRTTAPVKARVEAAIRNAELRATEATEAVELSPEPGRKVVALVHLDHWSCRWPIGAVGQPSFGFCGCRTALPYPADKYCPEHKARAYAGFGKSSPKDFARLARKADRR